MNSRRCVEDLDIRCKRLAVEVHMFWCGSAGFRIYTVLYVLIPHVFAPIHSFMVVQQM